MSKKPYPKHRQLPKTINKRAQVTKRKPAKNKPGGLIWIAIIEICTIIITLSLLSLLFIGYLANHFSGTNVIIHLLPFSIGLIAFILLAAWLLKFWGQYRLSLIKKWRYSPLFYSMAICSIILYVIDQQAYWQQIQHFKNLVGGKQLVQSENVAHQVYAAYRRLEPKLEMQLISRAQAYRIPIQEAAKHYGLDPDLLMGIAATESSFLPRDSFDGGHGLFQITAVAGFIQQETRELLAVKQLDLHNTKHNAYLAAATLKFYLSQMHQDLYLALLAYNIGPRNGGLRFIMDQYHAHDFVSMQPYLQTLPRDYPIRVLSHALAFRLWQKQGKLLAYQEAQNAQFIQTLGIPGM